MKEVSRIFHGLFFKVGPSGAPSVPHRTGSVTGSATGSWEAFPLFLVMLQLGQALPALPRGNAKVTITFPYAKLKQING